MPLLIVAHCKQQGEMERQGKEDLQCLKQLGQISGINACCCSQLVDVTVGVFLQVKQK